MYTFLQQFFEMYPQYIKLPFYVIGESYGGHYVPAVSSKIVQENDNQSNIYIDLRGVGIGNGWTNPRVQYGAYGPFAYENELINDTVYAQINETYDTCLQYITTKDWDDAEDVCGTIMGMVLEAAGNINYYDIDLQCNPPPLCYNLSAITDYLNEMSVQEELGVNNISWAPCSFQVNSAFGVDRIESFAYDIPFLLDNGVSVLVYSGMLDLICNYVGGRMWTNALQWAGTTQFNNMPIVDWNLSGSAVGHFKSYMDLTWLEIEDAGHMVPHDQPEVALQMLYLFLHGMPFN